MNNILFFLAVIAVDVDPKNLFKPGELAFDGYDLVSYFHEQPQIGDKNLRHEYKGVILHFSSSENLESFKKYPEKYWPAFNGWCAISLVYKVMRKPDFTLYKVQNGRLYFFEIRAFFNGLTQWNRDPQKNEIVAKVHFEYLTEDQ